MDATPFWSDEQKAWIQGSPLEKGTEDLESLWHGEWRAWGPGVVSWAHTQGLDIGWPLYKWSLSILASRAFSSSVIADVLLPCSPSTSPTPALSVYNPDMLLYPGIDSLDHSPYTKNYWQTDQDAFTLICNDEPEPGDQIWNPYGAKNNGQLMLSFGFSILENVHDAFPLKIKAPDHVTANDTAQGAGLPDTRDTMPNSNETRQPCMDPEAHDPSKTTFYIRKRSRNLAEHLLGYIDANWKPDSQQALPRLATAFSGIPLALLDRLALIIASSNDTSQLEAIKTNPPDPSRSPTLCIALGARNTLSVMNLLLNRLRHEDARLTPGLANLSTSTPTPTTPAQDARRHRLAHTYMTGQRDILRSNIANLQAGLTAALAAASSDQPRSCLLTLPVACAWLARVSAVHADALVAALRALLDADDRMTRYALFRLARDRGIEEDLWALWLGLLGGLERSGANGTAEALLAWRVRLWREDCSEEGGGDAARHLAGVVTRVRASGDACGVWAERWFSDEELGRLGRVVLRNTLEVKLTEGGEGLERREDGEGAENGNDGTGEAHWESIVAMVFEP